MLTSSAFNKKYYVYTLLSLRDYTLFTGLTTDLKTRLNEHARGLVHSAEMRIPFKLVHYEYFVNLEDAREREMYLKTGEGRAMLKEMLNKTLRDRRSFPYRIKR